MKVSRRGMLAGLVAAGAVLPTGYFAWQKWDEAQEAELASDEPAVPVDDVPNALLGERLTGIWEWHLVAGDAALPELARPLELLLDVGQGARAVRGYLGLPPYADGMQVYAPLAAERLPHLRLKLISTSGQGYDCEAVLDEIWGGWSQGGGGATLSGQVRLAGVQAGFSGPQGRFVARRRPFVPARERLAFVPALHEQLISPGWRYFHQLWHATRDRWHRIDESRRQAVRGLGWQAGPLGKERNARGHDRHLNGSGEDFLFMHRHMLHGVRQVQDLRSWPCLPAPRPFVGENRQAFADYMNNVTGYSVPPCWQADDDDHFNQWLYYIKSREGLYANFQLWEAQLHDPEYLSTLCLGELGSRIELGIHDWLHMRWAAMAQDPNTGWPMAYARRNHDFSERWFGASNDFLGDPFSSHVNPVFWAFHGWLDDRLEDWFLAHEQAHPGEVRRLTVNGIPWFAPGRWVRVAEPWLGPSSEGCGAWGKGNGGGSQLDIETMKLALQVIFSPDQEAERLMKRVPPSRPWFARYLAPGPRKDGL
ncbi:MULTISPECIES: pyoverdine maturation tyrosinase PvdP [Pseudomonas]|uniref:pyoverdine maturation tyrosinase PvdP n=1 Tax=Pseudomonas TaxID=286 RepID=UPI001CE44354|nr:MULTISPECIES: PvdJ/PvdD/PvdP-like protein [unclassified Pseudomonas]MBS6036931.1 PvdJ/PvdD/PvdP-like protein [Pseudomonas sp.]CAH0647656.1 hypothetical protein PSNVIR_01907 [Pseudomonas sp. Nvir]